MHVVCTGNHYVRYEPSECDAKLLRENLMRFSDKRLEGVTALKSKVAFAAEYLRMSQRNYLNRYIAPLVIEELEAALATGGIDQLFEQEPSSEATVPGALITREAVQEEIDALRNRFGIEQTVRARFVENVEDVPGQDGTDASFYFEGLAFLPSPTNMEIIFADEFLTYAKPYRDYLLHHEFAHCLQVLDSWPFYGEKDERYEESFTSACAKLGVDPAKEGGYYPTGSYRIICRVCGDTKYTREDGTLRTWNMSMEEFTREFRCPHCNGAIYAERTEAPVFLLGDELFEVGPDEECKPLGTLKRP